MNRVNGIVFSLENEWLLSVGRDKYLQWHDCTTGKRLGGYQTTAWCTSLQYPFALLFTVVFFFNFYFLVHLHCEPSSPSISSDAPFVYLSLALNFRFG